MTPTTGSSPSLTIFVRAAGLLVGLTFLAAGLAVFVLAPLIATLPAAANANHPWPWPIGPLAVRFLAAAFLAWSTAGLLLAWRGDGPTAVAIATVLTIGSAFLLLHLALNLTSIDWHKPLAVVWFGLLVMIFLIGAAVSVLLRLVTRLSAPPLPPTPRTALFVDISIGLLTIVVGGTMLLFPARAQHYWPWDLANTTNVQFLGALFSAVGVSIAWVALQPSWYGYDILYFTAGTFALVALVASFMHWGLFAIHPILSWVFVVVYAVGAGFGFYPFFRFALKQSNRPQT